MEDTQLESVIANFLVQIQSKCLQIRKSSTSHTCEFLASWSGEWKAGLGKKLIRGIVTSWIDGYYVDQQGQLKDMLRALSFITLPFNLTEFVVEHLQSEAVVARLSNSSLSARFRVLELGVFVFSMQKCAKQIMAGPIQRQILTVIGDQIEYISNAGPTASKSCDKLRVKSEHELNVLLDTNPSILPVGVEVWVQSAELKHVTAASVLIRYLHTHQKSKGTAEQLANAKTALLEAYKKRFVAAKQSAGLTSPAWIPLLQTMLVAADWSGVEDSTVESLEAIAVKMMKKAPEGASHSIAVLVSSLPANCDLTSFITAGGAVLATIRMLKSSDETVRVSGLLLIRAIVDRCSEVTAFKTVVAQLVETVNGKGVGGALTQDYQKQTLWLALQYAAQQASRLLGRTAASDVTDSVVTVLPVEKEVDANVKLIIQSVLGQWMAHSRNAATRSAFFSMVKTGMEKTPQTASGWLVALHLAAKSNEDVITELESSGLLPLLVNIVKEAVKKTTIANVDGVLALGLIMRLVGLSSSALSQFEAAKLWSVVSQSNSFLYSKLLIKYVSTYGADVRGSQVSTLIEADKVLLSAIANFHQNGARIVHQSVTVSLACALSYASVNHAHHVIAGLQSEEACLSLLMCSLHPDVTVRCEVNHLIKKLINNDSTASELLLKALWKHVHRLGERKQRYQTDIIADFKAATITSDESSEGKPSGAAAGAKYADVVLPSHTALTAALLACVSSASLSSSNAVANAAHIAAHPFVTKGCADRAIKLWKQSDLHFTSAVVDVVVESIDASATNSVSFTRSASAVTLKIINSCTDDEGVSALLQKCMDRMVSRLESKALTDLSSEDVALCLNVEGAIAEAVARETDQLKNNVQDVEVTNADRKKTGPRSARRGMFGADAVEDEDWADRLKKEKAAKLAETLSASEQQLHDKISSQLRARVAELLVGVESVKYSLELLQSFVGLSASLAGQAVSRVLERGTLLDLMQSPLIASTAFAAVKVFCAQVLEDKFVAHSAAIAHSLRIVVESGVLCRDPVSAADPVMAVQEAYRYIVKVSGPILQAMRGVQLALNRFPGASESSVHLLFPILQGVLALPAVIPGTEMAFGVLDALWPSAESKVAALRVLQPAVLKTVLNVLSKPMKTEPASDKVFLRIATQQLPVTLDEWRVVCSVAGLLSPELKVRLVCLQAVQQIVERGLALTASLESEVLVVLWMMKWDESEAAQGLANQIWQGQSTNAVAHLYPSLEPFLNHPLKHVRETAAKGIAGVVALISSEGSSVGGELEALQQLFRASVPAKAAPPKPTTGVGSNKLMSIAQLNKKAPEDTKVELRVAVAGTFAAIGVQHSFATDLTNTVCSLLDFIVRVGVIDPHADVRAAMLLAGRALIDSYGKELCSPIRVTLEEVLAHKPVAGEDVVEHDHRHGAAVVLLGAAGRHLDKDDPAVMIIINSLVEALKTPSETVQRSVADCLAPIVQVVKANPAADELVESLMTKTLEAASYGERRGAAYGLSAVVKGLGIPSLKQHDVVNRLKESCNNGSVNNRQGALFAFECFAERLGLLFEPYVIVIVPSMLKSFSHSSDHVRDAAQGAAKVIMSRLSAHGVKQVLTPILTSLPVETAWKSRQEAIRLLGMMAHCAPKQLSACLPQIVPCLVDAGSDPHPKVKESAKAAMSDISSVIRNPEVARLSPILLLALGDPANKTKEALENLLECEFMHSIDAPSLALLVPILGRALRDRGADLKRKAAAITGNIMTMVSEPKALAPYLPQVLPGLKDCLMDPIPDVRASSAKAVGSLFAGVGEADLAELVPWLIVTLRSDKSPVERSGAAQGLSEICGQITEDSRVEEILLQVLRMKNESASAAREGMLWFLSFLPTTLNEGFATYISISLPVILSGLSDESDGVRDVAMRAGQVVVSKLGLNHTRKLLPSLCDGIFHEDWRIRQSSVKLLGELLYLVGDTKAVGLADGEEEDDEIGAGSGVGSTSRVALTIKAHIGEKQTHEVLASLYIVRSDIASSVRQAALQIWKSIVSNTPRTLVEIMPVLVLQLIAKLSAADEDLRVVAGRALGELVRKLGDRVLPVIVPHLRQGLRSPQESMRQGACSGLTEILTACNRKQAEDYIEVLMPALKEALCDSSEDVATQAAQAFMTLFKSIGVRAIDEVVPQLLGTLAASESEESAFALRGLRAIVQLRPRELIEYLLPTLLVSPIQIVSAKALGSVAEVAGSQLNYHFHTVIPGLVQELLSSNDKVEKLKAKIDPPAEGSADAAPVSPPSEKDHSDLRQETERFAAVKSAASAVMAAVTTSGVHQFISELGKQIEHETNVKRRRWGCWLAEQFVTGSTADYFDYLPVFLKFILSRVAEFDKPLLQAVSDCLSAISAKVELEELVKHITFIRSCISSTASSARHKTGTGSLLISASGEFQLPLFSLPKSLDPLLNIFLFGLMNGYAEMREHAAEAISEIVQMSDASVLKPVLVKTTGPLIRVIADKFPSNVKSAILQALIVLLDKGGASLKAFVPQLQTTFVKSLNDPAREVRMRGGVALGKLMSLTVRVDPLLNELCAICLQADSNAIRSSVLDAVVSVLSVAGDKATSASFEKLRAVVMQNMTDEEENIRVATSHCVGAMAAVMDSSQATDLLIDLVDAGKTEGTGMAVAHKAVGRLLSLGALLHTAGQRVGDTRDEAFALVLSGLRDDRPSVKAAACRAVARMATLQSHAGWEDRRAEYRTCGQQVVHAFAAALGSAGADSTSGEVRLSAITAIKQCGKFYLGASNQHLKEFLPPLIAAVKDINIQVKYVAERALKHLSEGGTSSSSASTTPTPASSAASGALTSAFNAHLASVDAETGRFVKDYLRKFVSKLPADSDDESADKW